jgi:hypothetical protein
MTHQRETSTQRRTFVGGLATLGAAWMTSTAHAARPLSPEDARLKTDWPFFARYRDENAALRAGGAPIDCVFIGDSITEGWLTKYPAFFRPGRVCRGIGGQTTPQMLVRFRADVIELRPRAVHIMAGTNDFAGNTGPMTIDATKSHLMSMSELAQAHRLAIVLASIPPAAAFPWRPGIEPAQGIRALNAWLAEYAASIGAVFADYHAVLSDAAGAMRADFSNDGVHPTPAGYAAIHPVADAAVDRALGTDPRRSLG